MFNSSIQSANDKVVLCFMFQDIDFFFFLKVYFTVSSVKLQITPNEPFIL